MKKIVKPLFFTVLSIALTVQSHSQLKLPIGNGFTADIKKVIRDYPHQFSNMRGGIIEENPQATDYECSFAVSGSESSSITRYSSGQKPVYSWQAVMVSTEDFEVAKKKYQMLYSQFNNMGVKMDYGVTFYLKGKFQAPAEERTFTSSIFAFELADQITHKMKLELSMVNEMLEWKVKILIYERDREDDERGEVVE